MNQDRVQVNVKHGVCSVEIYNVRMEDAGKYSCLAESPLGSEETSCVLSVQGNLNFFLKSPEFCLRRIFFFGKLQVDEAAKSNRPDRRER